MVDQCEDRTRTGFVTAGFVRWTVASGFSFFVVLGLTMLLHEVLFVSEKIAFLVPLIVVLVANFFTCRWFVFRGTPGEILPQFAGYALSSAGFRLTEYLVYWILLDCLGLWYVAAAVIVMPTSFIIKFLFFGLLVFQHGTAGAAAAGNSGQCGVRVLRSDGQTKKS